MNVSIQFLKPQQNVENAWKSTRTVHKARLTISKHSVSIVRDKNFFEQKVKFLFGDVMFDTVEEIIDDKSNKTTIMKW